MDTGDNSGPVILFDLDGVLVDSQEAEIAAHLDLAERLGAPRTEGLPFTIAGRRMQDSVDLVASWVGVAVPPDALMYVRERAAVRLAGQMRPIPYVGDALALLPNRKYVVSNSPLGMIEDRLQISELSAYFAGPHFSAYEYETWKPAPELYRVALRTLGLTRGQAIAIEDSLVGVTAAAGAGLHVLWYRAPLQDQEAVPDNVEVFSDMRCLPETVRYMIRNLPR